MAPLGTMSQEPWHPRKGAKLDCIIQLNSGKCAPMQVIKQPEHGRTLTTEDKKWSSFRTMTGLSVNILGPSFTWPIQRGFFKNSMGDLLNTLKFLSGLYTFCNFVIIFSLMSWWYVEEQHIFQIQKWLNTTRKGAAEIRNLRKNFLWFMLGPMIVMGISDKTLTYNLVIKTMTLKKLLTTKTKWL